MDDSQDSVWGALNGFEYPFGSSRQFHCCMSSFLDRLCILYYVVTFNHRDLCIADIKRSKCLIHILRILLDTHFDSTSTYAFIFRSILAWYSSVSEVIIIIIIMSGLINIDLVPWFLRIVYCLMPKDYYTIDDFITWDHHTWHFI